MTPRERLLAAVSVALARRYGWLTSLDLLALDAEAILSDPVRGDCAHKCHEDEVWQA